MNSFTTLESFVSSGQCDPFIYQIRFPKFKNLSNAHVDFEYPITALIGQNGTNKSSILRALQACPEGQNIGDYWFDTALDRIESEGVEDNTDGNHRYIHQYRTRIGTVAEVVQTRTKKEGRHPDYFETARPRIRDGMTRVPKNPHEADKQYLGKSRWAPIRKEVVYLDFRQELPAFDILMSFNWRRRENSATAKKRDVRRYSQRVKEALETLTESQILYNTQRILSPAEELSRDEVEAISEILGREYTSVRLVKHDLFGVEGWTASLTTTHRKYSEAFAGSGEFAAIMLVRGIYNAAPKSLILLDEPETSLHPAAQASLIEFIARQCVKKKHQVVISTHSPAIVEPLPNVARKLLASNPSTGNIEIVSQSSSASESFSRIGVRFTPTSVIVEDSLAAEIVRKAARGKGIDFLKSFDITSSPGGASTILNQVLPAQEAVDGQCTILLDGDQRRPTPYKPFEGVLSVADSSLACELKTAGVSPKSILSDGGNVTDDAKNKRLRSVLKWHSSNVRFLPTHYCPEVLLLKMLGRQPLPVGTAEAKQHWVDLTISERNLLPGEKVDSRTILEVQRGHIAKIPDDDPHLMEIRSILNESLERSTHA